MPTEYKASAELIQEVFVPHLTREAIQLILADSLSPEGAVDASHLFFNTKKAFRNLGDRGKDATDPLAKKLINLPEYGTLSIYDLKQQAYQTIDLIQDISRRVYDVIEGKAEMPAPAHRRVSKVA